MKAHPGILVACLGMWHTASAITSLETTTAAPILCVSYTDEYPSLSDPDPLIAHDKQCILSLSTINMWLPKPTGPLRDAVSGILATRTAYDPCQLATAVPECLRPGYVVLDAEIWSWWCRWAAPLLHLMRECPDQRDDAARLAEIVRAYGRLYYEGVCVDDRGHSVPTDVPGCPRTTDGIETSKRELFKALVLGAVVLLGVLILL